MLQVSIFDTIPVVVFRNKTRDSVEAWVCENVTALAEAKAQLQEMPHIEILTETDAHICRQGGAKFAAAVG